MQVHISVKNNDLKNFKTTLSINLFQEEYAIKHHIFRIDFVPKLNP